MVTDLNNGATFKKFFACLEKGEMSIYANEEAYAEYAAPVIEPFKMTEYRLVTDPEEMKASSVNPAYRIFRKQVSGHANLTLLQSRGLTDGVNLYEASQKYTFNLVPKVCLLKLL